MPIPGGPAHGRREVQGKTGEPARSSDRPSAVVGGRGEAQRVIVQEQ